MNFYFKFFDIYMKEKGLKLVMNTMVSNGHKKKLIFIDSIQHLMPFLVPCHTF
jgi:hypothetical protein